MPLLPLEPFVFPESLFAGPPPMAGEPACWWALHTRPRVEKTLARRFLSRGLSFFLPLHKNQWRNRGRLFSSHMPLFPGYIFLYGDNEGRVAALETNLVVRCLSVSDSQQLHHDLARVHQLILSDAPLTPEERLQPGSPIEIIAGPLTGLQGKVLRRGKQLKLLVEVQFLQQGVSAEVESWMIRPLEVAPITGRDAAPAR